MLCICSKHVKDGISHFKTPHVNRINFFAKCRFCDQKAIFGIYLLNENEWRSRARMVKNK
ncbi:hypothetical protein COJ36_26965 [Priestia megaterium]|jgi:hypothetical protein|nr:hypothetical protein C2I28_26535 [Priestia megaterium]PFL61094.1 hypothetical protein COJ36_26965 [Priestia megaterium]